jgi:hypothetical protein
MAHLAFLTCLAENHFETVLDQEREWYRTEMQALYNIDLAPKEQVLANLKQHGKPSNWYGKAKMIQSVLTSWISIKDQMETSATYQDQLQLYGQPLVMPSDLELKPFEILKVVYNGGAEVVLPHTPNVAFQRLQNDPIVVLDLNLPTAPTIAREYFDHCCGEIGGNRFEGVVIKPIANPSETIIPFIKVRNPRYLTLIYGPNYQLHGYFAEKGKNVPRKLKQSAVDYKLGLSMLHQPYASLHCNVEMERLIREFLCAEAKSRTTLDARL